MKYHATLHSADSTIKYVFSVIASKFGRQQEVSIESAFITLPKRDDDKPEHMLCLSSQAGCVYGCLMCANMFTQFYRVLSPGEINQQIDLTLAEDHNLEKILRAGKVEYSFMAIGEPLFKNNAIDAIKSHKKKVGDTRFALSTIGIPGSITRLSEANLQYPVRLELSLHFPNDALRNTWLVPKVMLDFHIPTLNINDMLDEAEAYAKKHKSKITLNYTLIDGINNGDEHIHQLKSILEKKTDIFYVKVMEPNMTSAFVFSWPDEKKTGHNYHSPIEFRKALQKEGIPATFFGSKGRDISAGCGMMCARTNQKGGIISPETMAISQANPEKLGFKTAE